MISSTSASNGDKDAKACYQLVMGFLNVQSNKLKLHFTAIKLLMTVTKRRPSKR